MTPKMNTDGDVTNEAAAFNSEAVTACEEAEPLKCQDCDIEFTDKHYLYDHLFHHIKQPQILISRVQLPPLKITLKNKTGNFEIVNYLSPEQLDTTTNLADIEEDKESPDGNSDEIEHEEGEEDSNVTFSPNFAEVNIPEASPANSDSSNGAKIDEGGDGFECGSIPGAEPTPPPEPSPDYPKIRIKTTGLLKEPLTITEIVDDNPEEKQDRERKSSWNNSEDPLKLPGTDDILSIFNNNERAKDLGFTTSDTDFMPLDRLGERNGPMQLYNQNQMNQNALSSLTGLPMEALAQQVSRLQPSGNGMHQQNVLINIQQFPQAPPAPPPYHPPNMYHHPPQPMYHPPYPSYQPPNHMYYPPPGGYPQHMPPPQPQMPPIGQGPMGQPPSSQSQNMPQNQPYRQLAPRQQAPPRQMAPQPQRMPGNPRGPTPAQRQPIVRQRAPMVRPRGGGMTAVRSVRPRMPVTQNQNQNGGKTQAIKRSPEQLQSLQSKKKRLDVLTPDKDDEDCQVICMQPKNTDGGLPQISSVQGGTAEPSENSVMHLSDSITLSVRNPQPRPQSPKKSDAKAVANILATRGITVTATPKPKEKSESQKNPSIQAQLNLNSAVSIIPSNKTPNKPNSQESHLPTVDLTDDASPVSQIKNTNNAQKAPQRQGLPFKCDLCPAQYPNAIGLSKHRQNYHKTNSGMCEIGVPLINLKQPGIFQKLSSLGIYNYIPLPTSGPDGVFALPIINARSPGNVAALGATTMLTLGPVRNIPKPLMANGMQANKQMNQNQNK